MTARLRARRASSASSMSAESASSDRVCRAVVSSCSSTVVLILTRAMPHLYHICGTGGCLRESDRRDRHPLNKSASERELGAPLADGEAAVELHDQRLRRTGREVRDRFHRERPGAGSPRTPGENELAC